MVAEAIVRDAYLCINILVEQIKHSVPNTKVYGPTWGPPGTQVVPVLAPWTLLSGVIASRFAANTRASIH